MSISYFSVFFIQYLVLIQVSLNGTNCIQYSVYFNKTNYLVFVKFTKTNIFGIQSIFTIRCNSGGDQLKVRLTRVSLQFPPITEKHFVDRANHRLDQTQVKDTEAVQTLSLQTNDYLIYERSTRNRNRCFLRTHFKFHKHTINPLKRAQIS